MSWVREREKEEGGGAEEEEQEGEAPEWTKIHTFVFSGLWWIFEYYFRESWPRSRERKTHFQLSDGYVCVLTQKNDQQTEGNWGSSVRSPLVWGKNWIFFVCKSLFLFFLVLCDILCDFVCAENLCFFCPSLGRGRTTTGTVIATLLLKLTLPHLQPPPSPAPHSLAHPISTPSTPSHPGTLSPAGSPPGVNIVSPLGTSPKSPFLQLMDDEEVFIHYSKGEYKVILRLIRVLSNGVWVKEQLDNCIDLCEAMQNLRQVFFPSFTPPPLFPPPFHITHCIISPSPSPSLPSLSSSFWHSP